LPQLDNGETLALENDERFHQHAHALLVELMVWKFGRSRNSPYIPTLRSGRQWDIYEDENYQVASGDGFVDAELDSFISPPKLFEYLQWPLLRGHFSLFRIS